LQNSAQESACYAQNFTFERNQRSLTLTTAKVLLILVTNCLYDSCTHGIHRHPRARGGENAHACEKDHGGKNTENVFVHGLPPINSVIASPKQALY
jgi:hypothetical protein